MNLKEVIRVIPDFPRAGISYKDITTLLNNAQALQQTIQLLAGKCRGLQVEQIVCPEARGFAIGAPLAYELGAGLVLLRKPGKLPGEVMQGKYELEYGQDALEIHKDALTVGQRVLIVDDLLATGGTVSTAQKLVEKLGGNVVGAAFVIELTDLKGREKLKNCDVLSLVQYNI